MMKEGKYVDDLPNLPKDAARLSDAEACREVVYEDETILLERLWSWKVKNIEEDEETGLLRLSFGKKFALASVEGKLLCPPVFDCLEDFNEGLAFAGIYDEPDGKLQHFFVDRNMKVAFTSPFQETEGFMNGRARGFIQLENAMRFWFYIDKDGNPFLFDSNKPKYSRFGEFHEGLCRVSTINIKKDSLAGELWYDWPRNYMDENEPGFWGFVNEEGEEVIKAQYIFTGDFHNGVAVACKGKWEYREDWFLYENEASKGYWSEEMKWGVIDKGGNEVIPFIYKYILRCEAQNGEEDVFSVEYGDDEHTQWGVIDAKGNWIAKSNDRNIVALTTPTKDGLFVFLDSHWPLWEPDSEVGIYDSRKNEILFEPRFFDAGFLDDGGILLNGKMEDGGRDVTRIVDRDGKERFSSDYSWIITHTKPYMVARDKKGEYISVIGFIDENGKVLLPCVYEVQELCDDVYYEQRRFVFVKNGRQGLMDFDGNVLISPIFGNLFGIDQPLATFQKQSEWDAPLGLLTLDGREVLPDEFDAIRWCEDKRHIICLRNGVFEMYLLTEKSTMGNTVQRNE